MVKKILTFFLRVYSVFDRPYIKGLPGELAFFFMWSIAPFILLIAQISHLLNINLDNLIHTLEQYTLPEFVDVIVPFLYTTPDFNGGILLFVLFALYLSSKGFNSVIRASNLMYGLENQPNFIMMKFKSIVMTFIIVLMLIVMLILPVLGSLIFKIIIEIANLSAIYEFLWNIFRWVFSLSFIFIGIQFLYTVAPNHHITVKSTRYGSIFTTFGWIIASAIFSFYLSNYANYDAIYGSLSSIIILMFWFYILAYIFVIGMAVNVVLSER